MAKLYEICNELDAIIEHGKVFVSTETGEVFTPDALDALKLEKAEKVDNCLMVMRQYETDAAGIDLEIERLTALKKHYASRAKWLKEYVKDCLNGEEFKSGKFKVTYWQSRAIVFTDWRKVPEQYFKDQTEKDISKVALMDVLKNGGTVPGVVLEERINMVVK